jgi:hypothetical protein
MHGEKKCVYPFFQSSNHCKYVQTWEWHKVSVWSLKKGFGDRFGVLAFQFTQMNTNLEISQCMGFQVFGKGCDLG